MDEQAQAILNELNRRAALDPQLRQIMKKIDRGKADFSDTALLSQRMGNLLGELFGAEVLDIPEDAREAVCKDLLRGQYDFTNETLEAVQEALDASQGISLTPQLAAFPAERVQQLAHSLLDPTVALDVIQRRADKPAATVAKSFHDDNMNKNAALRAKLGMKPTITRYGTGCCAWCSAVAGKYRFGEQPDDIFRRHDNCDCVVIYDNQVLRGARTADGGRSKTWEEVDPAQVMRDGFKPGVFSEREARELEETLLERLTLSGERGILREDSKKPITEITDAAINRVPFVKISGYTEEQCKRIQELHCVLLEESRTTNGGNEVAFVLNSVLDDKKTFYGEDDKIDFGYLYGKNLVILHNHPRNSSYSFSDIVEFFGSDQVQTLTIVKNNGRVETLTKISEYDIESTMKELLRKGSRAEKTGLDSEFRKVVDKFLGKYAEGGVIEWVKC